MKYPVLCPRVLGVNCPETIKLFNLFILKNYEYIPVVPPQKKEFSENAHFLQDFL
jgi:hypothetical protein